MKTTGLRVCVVAVAIGLAGVGAAQGIEAWRGGTFRQVADLKVSANAHVIASYHATIDKVTERFLGKNQIGTTGRGIGPAYGDKVGRTGIRAQDLLDTGILRKKLELVLREKNQILVKVYNRKAIDVDAVIEEYLEYAERLTPYIAETRVMLWDALDRGEDPTAG